MASACTIPVSFSAEETHALLQDVPSAYRTQINDVLLTALGQAFSGWSGAQVLLIDLEGHGREEILEDVDLSRTVGWFTSICPVLLDLKEVSRPANALISVKEQLRDIPNRGIGYGLLRYLSSNTEIRERLRSLPQPEVSFNYLGQFDQAIQEGSAFRVTRESVGPTRSLTADRAHLIEINGSVVEDRLRINFTYSENLHRQATIEGLARGFEQALRTLIAHCQSSEAGGYTASDFVEAGLSQEELDDLLAQLDRSAE